MQFRSESHSDNTKTAEGAVDAGFAGNIGNQSAQVGNQYPFTHRGEPGYLGSDIEGEGIRDDNRQDVPSPTLKGAIPHVQAGESGYQLDPRPVYVNGEFPRDSLPATRFVTPHAPD